MPTFPVLIAGKERLISSQADLVTFLSPDLLEAYNRLLGKSTTKFASRDKGLAQVWAAIQASVPDVGATAQEEPIAELGKPSQSTPETPTVAPAAAPTEGSTGAGVSEAEVLETLKNKEQIQRELAAKLVRKGKTMRNAATGERALFFRMPLGGPNHLTPREARKDSARAKALALLRREQGATFEEVMAETGWNRDQAYEGVRILNIFLGWRLDTDDQGRIRAFNTRA